LFGLIPRETKFFDMFAEMSANLIDGAKLMSDLLGRYTEVPERINLLRDIEHKGDDMTHALMLKLNQTFITPFDREDIHHLASRIDDVLDLLNAAGDRLVIYGITNPPEAARHIADILWNQAVQIQKAVGMLDKTDAVLECCVEINSLENQADNVARSAIARLFETEKDPIVLIKHKELIEVLESATDRAEDVANVLESVVVKSA
jgi:uncharacterized protein